MGNDNACFRSHNHVFRSVFFHDQTQPLIDWYGKKGLLSAVDASQAPEAAYGDIAAILKRHGAS